jgi:hypothetical protein
LGRFELGPFVRVSFHDGPFWAWAVSWWAVLYVHHLNTRKTREQLFLFDFCQLILKYRVRFHLQLNVSYLCDVYVWIKMNSLKGGYSCIFLWKLNCTKDNSISSATCPVHDINKYFQINSEKCLDP